MAPLLGMCARGRLGGDTLGDALHPADGQSGIVIDLREMTSIDPLGIVSVACLVQRATGEGYRAIVRGPADETLMSKLHGCLLGLWLNALGAEHDLPLGPPDPAITTEVTMSAFDGSRGADRVATALHSALESTSRRAADAAFKTISEAGQNVQHHSGRYRGFIAVTSGGRGILRLAVGDCGAGMFSTLRVRGAGDDATALRLAIQPGVSENQGAGRGRGVPDMLRYVTEVDGTLEIISGDARIVGNSEAHVLSRLRTRYEGVLLQAELGLHLE
jgi:hypothetical protein